MSFSEVVRKGLKNRKKPWAEHSRVKCDCGHYPKDHYNCAGWCDKCGCTWYYPNYRYIKKKQKALKK